MKKIIVLFLIIIVFYSCKRIEKEYYPDGKLKVEAQYKDNFLNGNYKEYYQNGNLAVEENYKNGKLEGIKKVYFENGNIEWEAIYKEGVEDGLHKKYSGKGILLLEAYFKNGKQDGLTKSYYEDGLLESKQEYKNDIPNGKALFYYTNGQLKMDAIVDNDETIYYKKYDEQGNLLKEWRFVSIEVPSDTINLSDTYTARIKIYGPLPEDTMYFQTQLYYKDNNGVRELKEDWHTFAFINGEASYTYKPDTLGVHLLCVYVNKKDALRRSYGERYFFVVDKSKI